MWRLDLAFADVVATTSEPALSAIRLAWWRERLEELDAGLGAPAEPRLAAVAAELLPRGISGKALSQLEDAWLPLLSPFPWGAAAAEGMRLRGRLLFGAGARLLDADAAAAEPAGAVWSLIDAAQHCSDAESRAFLLAEARAIELPRKAPAALRALTVLTALAAVNIREPTSGVARGLAASRHRLTGRFPRLG